MTGRRLTWLAGWALVLVAICSCGGPSFDFTGRWVGKRDFPKMQGDDDAVLHTLAKVELTIKPEGRFELFEGGMAKSGRFRRSGQSAFLTVTHFMDRPIEAQGSAAVEMNKEIQLKARPDGSIIFTDPGAIWQEPVTLHREKESTQP